MIPESAVEALREQIDAIGIYLSPKYARAALEAAAPHMLAGAELMRWKLDALKEWSDAMIDESNSPQYGRDVRTLLEVGGMDEARECEAP